MENQLTCALIISTYNWKEALDRCLQSVLWQSQLPNEVLIADDGSRNDTKELIQTYQAKFPMPLIHIWLENTGSKTFANNKAFATAKSDYIICIDHDIVLHREFIKDHLSLAEKNYFVNGSRFLLDQVTTKKILVQKDLSVNMLEYVTGKNGLNKLRIPFLMRFLTHRYQTSSKYIWQVRGCNMAFWKTDLITVNGYEEIFKGWGREDSDLGIRLSNAGVQKKVIKFGGIGYHLDHPVRSRADDPDNIKRMRETIQNKNIVAKNGLSQYL